MNLLRCLITVFILPAALTAQHVEAHSFQFSLDHALHGSSASAVIVDVAHGKLLANYRLALASPQEPGSTLKPLVAAIAIKSKTATARTEVQCNGTLIIGQHNLRCSHPRSITIFDLQRAIAYSCNSWFAQLAAHMSASQLNGGLRSYGLSPDSTAATTEQRQLSNSATRNLPPCRTACSTRSTTVWLTMRKSLESWSPARRAPQQARAATSHTDSSPEFFTPPSRASPKLSSSSPFHKEMAPMPQLLRNAFCFDGAVGEKSLP